MSFAKKTMIQEYINQLNEAQRAPVLQKDGPMIVIAGAGSGKTRVLTMRIAYLMSLGVDAFNILSLTFTNKAAREMKKRISDIVGSNEAKNLWMGTFHSVFAKILRIEADKLGYPSNFTIYDAQDSVRLIGQIIKEMQLDKDIYKPKQVLSLWDGTLLLCRLEFRLWHSKTLCPHPLFQNLSNSQIYLLASNRYQHF